MTTKPTPSCGHTAGFTLLEVLAAVLVLGMIITMLSNGLRFGLQATQMLEGDDKSDMLAVDQALRQVIAQADPGIYPEPASLRGTAAALSLTTELPAGGPGPIRRADVLLAATGGRLIMRWRPHHHAEWFDAGPVWSEEVVATGVEHAEFAYFGGRPAAGWSAGWSADRLPAFVRLTLTLSGHRHWAPMIVAVRREALDE